MSLQIVYTYYDFPSHAFVSVTHDISITVTPVVTSYASTYRDVLFKNGVNGLLGLIAGGVGGQQGAEFDVTLRRTCLPGEPTYIQNVMDVHNAPGGAAAAAFDHVMGSGFVDLNVLPDPGVTFPILDTGVGDPLPDFTPITFVMSTADIVQITTYDSPGSAGNLPGMASLEFVDYTGFFRMYVAWRFPDSSLYPFPAFNWKVVFRAHTFVAGAGVTVIDGAAGVFGVAPGFEYTTDTPVLVGPLANETLKPR